MSVAASVSSHREFQVGEVEHLHAAFLVRSGKTPYQDYWESHNPALHYLLAGLIDPADPVRSYQRGRALSFLLLLGTVGIASVCAWYLGRWPAAVMTAGLLLLQTTFVERGMEARPDIAMTFCVMAALAAELGVARRLRRHCLQAVLLSAVFLTLGAALKLNDGPVRIQVLLAAALLAASHTSIPRLSYKAVPNTEYQFAHPREIQRITDPGNRVFDLAGMCFREDAYQPFTMPGVVMRQQAVTGAFPVLHEHLRKSPPAAWIANYRTAKLPREARRFLRENYAHHAGRIHVLGQRVSLNEGESTRLVAPRSRRYVWEGTAALWVDGQRFSNGTLSAGEHQVTAEAGPARGRLRIQLPDGVPPPVLQMLRPLFVAFT